MKLRYPTIRGLSLISLPAVLCASAVGQEFRVQDQRSPPPFKIIPRLERNQLNSSKDPKARVRTTLELADSYLTAAETKTAQSDFDGAASAAGKYSALIENVFEFMKTMEQDSNKTRDLYKRVELALRAHGPRLTGMRRSTPVEYAVWIKEIEEMARRGRTEALNSFYGHTVVREPKSDSTQKQVAKPVQKDSTPPDKEK
ncbi:MAG TPA: hypothetical protein VGW36_03825 [Pyrinomonadaceae bacterium]|nr:hypothetical protein [Pyrinomonadaceae bacterium]